MFFTLASFLLVLFLYGARRASTGSILYGIKWDPWSIEESADQPRRIKALDDRIWNVLVGVVLPSVATTLIWLTATTLFEPTDEFDRLIVVQFWVSFLAPLLIALFIGVTMHSRSESDEDQGGGKTDEKGKEIKPGAESVTGRLSIGAAALREAGKGKQFITKRSYRAVLSVSLPESLGSTTTANEIGAKLDIPTAEIAVVKDRMEFSSGELSWECLFLEEGDLAALLTLSVHGESGLVGKTSYRFPLRAVWLKGLTTIRKRVLAAIAAVLTAMGAIVSLAAGLTKLTS